MKRLMIRIDEDKCNGCGLCVPSCAEGAIQIIDGKARLVADNLCDGLGACLGDCPQGALTLHEREAEAFDEVAVEKRLKEIGQKPEPSTAHHSGCPGTLMQSLKRTSVDEAGEVGSELTQWPVQLGLVGPQAPYFKDADLLLAADCVAFAFGDFHRRLLKGKALAIACPKLDDARSMGYVEKLAAIISQGKVRSLTVAHMEVPCCFGLVRLAQEAVELSGREIPVKLVEISLAGEMTE